LRAYLLVLVLVMVHAIGLMIAATIISFNPSLVGRASFVPWSYLVFYLVTNLVLCAYIVALLVLVTKRRRSAVIHNCVFSSLTIVFHAAWHMLGMKSTIGMVIDSMPAVVGMLYFANVDQGHTDTRRPQLRSAGTRSLSARGVQVESGCLKGVGQQADLFELT
jgi:hypothetical protein